MMLIEEATLDEHVRHAHLEEALPVCIRNFFHVLIKMTVSVATPASKFNKMMRIFCGLVLVK